jgi:hypothetical protein
LLISVQQNYVLTLRLPCGRFCGPSRNDALERHAQGHFFTINRDDCLQRCGARCLRPWAACYYCVSIVNLPGKRTAYLVFLALTGVEKVVPEHPVSTADGVSPEGLNVVPEGATAKSATAKKVVALIKQMLKQKQGALRKRQAAEQAQQVICSAPQDRSQSMRSGRCQKLRRKDARAT